MSLANFFLLAFSNVWLSQASIVSHRVFVVILSFVHLDIRHLFLCYMKIFLWLVFSNLMVCDSMIFLFIQLSASKSLGSTDLVLSDLENILAIISELFSAPAFWASNYTYITLLANVPWLTESLDLRKNFFLSLLLCLYLILFLFLDYFYVFKFMSFSSEVT